MMATMRMMKMMRMLRISANDDIVFDDDDAMWWRTSGEGVAERKPRGK